MVFKTSIKNKTIIFEIGENFTDTECNELFMIVDEMLKRGKPFGFIADVRKATNVPIKIPFIIIKWMKKNRDKISGNIVASSIVFKSKKISDLIQFIFTRQKPVSPNLITLDIEESISFINGHI